MTGFRYNNNGNVSCLCHAFCHRPALSSVLMTGMERRHVTDGVNTPRKEKRSTRQIFSSVLCYLAVNRKEAGTIESAVVKWKMNESACHTVLHQQAIPKTQARGRFIYLIDDILDSRTSSKHCAGA